MDWPTKQITLMRQQAYNAMITEGIRRFEHERYQHTVEEALGFTRDELIRWLEFHGLYETWGKQPRNAGKEAGCM